MTDNYNQLTPAEDERLAILLEESGEVIQLIGKIQRHGYESYNPSDENKTTNRVLLEQELGDLLFAIEFMTTNKDISSDHLEKAKLSKNQRIWNYVHHQKLNGVVF
jgi:NTP pyrophosphatase (non-canonical NTP hydrolase)